MWLLRSQLFFFLILCLLMWLFFFSFLKAFKRLSLVLWFWDFTRSLDGRVLFIYFVGQSEPFQSRSSCVSISIHRKCFWSMHWMTTFCFTSFPHLQCILDNSWTFWLVLGIYFLVFLFVFIWGDLLCSAFRWCCWSLTFSSHPFL